MDHYKNYRKSNTIIIGTAKCKDTRFYEQFWNLEVFTIGRDYKVVEFEGNLGVISDTGEEYKLIKNCFEEIKELNEV